MIAIYILPFLLGTLCHGVCANESNSPRAVQFVSPVNHTFQLELNELKSILENENIKNHHVVVVSVAGAFRQGKSFLLNFFIKYLDAQYKKHDVTDFLGENDINTRLNGFKYRSGRKPETIGIWIWSEVFTHEYSNGEKVAIILIDTQGIFDSKSSIHDCTVIFALSTLLSSVQCYNLMQNIKEDDLQYLDLFSQYGRLLVEQNTNEKPFQKLIFIIRDWPYAFETNYGWDDHKVIVNETLNPDEDQTQDMHQLRSRIRSSFEEINAFLMPHPGLIVAQGSGFTGSLEQISADFKQYVKLLVAGIFAPEKLQVKKINGQILRARDLIQYLQAYTNVFNGDTLPAPTTVFRATAETSNQILYTDCLNNYMDAVQKSIIEVKLYFSESEFFQIHSTAKNTAISQFLSKPKLGGQEFATSFRNKLENSIEEKFISFKSENERKRLDFIQKANLYNDKVGREAFNSAKQKAHNEILASNLENFNLHNVCSTVKWAALAEFDEKKLGNADIAVSFREKLLRDLENFESDLFKTLEAFKQSQNHYSSSMQRSLDQVEYLEHGNLWQQHQRVKNEANAQFLGKSIDGEIKVTIQQKLDKFIEEKFPSFDEQNKTKRRNFMKVETELVRAEVVAFRWPVAVARCPSGSRLVGGGGNCRSITPVGWVFVAGNFPANDYEWIVRCDTPERQNVMGESWAICVKNERF
ncbi:atlastin-like [Contarinia nasturtii]|uniref:atlastin-like n=1 Tax=Contarinia nasturtii TaxID=265458 RepID=UPI0012D38D21|nr:atlastin-like [Contarinia nasturtii]